MALSTATLCAALFKHGLKNQFIQDVRPLNPGLPNMVGSIVEGWIRLAAEFSGLLESGRSSAAAGVSGWATATACRRRGLGLATTELERGGL